MLGFLKRWRSRPADDPFLFLMVVACEDQPIRQRLLGILSQDQFNRASLLNTWIQDLKLQGASESFSRALGFFLDENVAERARLILENQQSH